MTEEQRAELEAKKQVGHLADALEMWGRCGGSLMKREDCGEIAGHLRYLLATIARLEAEKVKDGEALERLASGEAFDLPQVISGPLAEELRMRMDFARARLSSRAKDQSQ